MASEDTAEMDARPTTRLNFIAVDSSEHSDRAFDWYLENHHREGNHIGIVHVHQMPSLPAMGLYAGGAVLSEGYQMMVQESIEQSKHIVEKYKKICEEKNISHTVYLQTADGGQPGATICKLATENGASVIVLGSRGLGTIRRTLLGSVSDYVVHHSHIPTIVIPPPMS